MNAGDDGLESKKRSAEKASHHRKSRIKRRADEDVQHHAERSTAVRPEENAFASLEALLTRENRTVQSVAQQSVSSSPSSLSSAGTSDSPQTKMAAVKKPQYDVAMNKDARGVGISRRVDDHCAQTTAIKTSRSAKKLPRVAHATISIVGSRYVIG